MKKKKKKKQKVLPCKTDASMQGVWSEDDEDEEEQEDNNIGQPKKI